MVAMNGNHGERGRFVPGNTASKGNPFALATAKLRTALLRAITEEDVAKAVQTLRDVMEHGKPVDRVAAARELLDRALGKPKETIEQELAVVGTAGEDSRTLMQHATPEEVAELRALQERLRERAREAAGGDE